MQGKRTNLTKVFLGKLFRYGISPVIFALALLFGLVAFNYVVAVKSPEFDVTKYKMNSLSDETTKLLDQIEFNVTIRAFYLTSSQRRISQILTKYAQRNSRVKVEFIDPLKNPMAAEKDEVTLPGTIVFDRAGKKTRINPDPAGRNIGEREITIALYRLITDSTKKIYVLSGHGELSVADTKPRGYSTVLDRLVEQNYVVEPLNIVEKNGVPKDCNLLVIPGPTVPFSENEARMLSEYIMTGGSFLLMIGPGKKTGIEQLAGNYGIIPGEDYVYETSRSATTQAGGAIAPICSAQDTSEITNKLANQSFLFPFVRSMTPFARQEGLTLKRLVASSANSWAETDLKSAETVNTGSKPSRGEKELKGPVTVAVTAEREFPLPDSLATQTIKTFKVRSAFFGNATFVTNEFAALFPSNISLFLNTVNWVTKNEKIIEITPHTTPFTPVELRDSDRRVISWFSVVLIPFAILMAGIVVWYRRR